MSDEGMISGESAAIERWCQIVASKDAELAALRAEVQTWRDGPITEEMLRRSDGAIHLAKGLSIVRDEDMEALRSDNAALRGRVRKLEKIRDGYKATCEVAIKLILKGHSRSARETLAETLAACEPGAEGKA